MLPRILILLLCFIGVTLKGQTVDAPADTTKPQKKTIKVNVIDPKGKKRLAYNGQPILIDSVQKAVKIDPTVLARGEFSVFYEWRLAQHFSVEGGVGITFIDFAYEIFENNGRFIMDGPENGNVQFHTGFAFRAQARYYPSRYETAISGFYMAPAFTYRSWNMEYFVSNGLISVPYDVKREWKEIRLQIGEQDPDPYSVVFTEWYLNFGVQFRDDDSVYGQGVTAELQHKTEMRWVFGAGVRIGFVL
ncbi:MAG TPA: hypothetical protein VK826_10880 [Bacteroidia bacterium]|nr:hypothetical protein [Bacteroidia bacterium]